VLSGKFQLEREIGRGGMGVVFEALDVQLGRRVAVKLVNHRLAESVASRERLVREARAAARLTSEHAVRIFHVGELEGGLPFVVMEFLEGETVQARLARRGPASTRRALRWMLEALAAVGEAHAHGLVHRDLKPANLFLERTHGGGERVKVLDFGLVKSEWSEDPALSKTGELIGTVAYMPPEQVRARKNLDSRADVWALGVTLFEMLTARIPFPAGTEVGMLRRIVKGQPVSLRSLRADVPEAIEAIVARCLDKDRGARFADANSLARAIRTQLERHGSGPLALGRDSHPPSIRPAKSRSGFRILVPAVALALLALVAFSLTARPRTERLRAASSAAMPKEGALLRR